MLAFWLNTCNHFYYTTDYYSLTPFSPMKDLKFRSLASILNSLSLMCCQEVYCVREQVGRAAR